MTKSLIIVESPTKAKAIKKYMGSAFQVKASVGHIKDLPVSALGVDVEKNFRPTYQIIKGKKKIVDEIVKAAASSDKIYLATDPDREGEAIAWHVAEEIGAKGKGQRAGNIHRVLLHEITPKAVKEAIAEPAGLDKNLYEAQQARRILDRLVGYKISPILWKKVQRGLSAGRVQSVAVRIICEREAEVKAFKPEEYWSVVANLEGSAPPPFEAKLFEIDGKKPKIGSRDEAGKIVGALKGAGFTLTKITRQERRRHPVPPFTTSKLQQESARKLGFVAKKTMTLAQQLYEGVDLGDGIVGLITYMRTDSVRVSAGALNDVRGYIAEKYGAESLPAEPNFYKNKRGAQDAHEAIRPTSMEYTPESVSQYLGKDHLRLYELIWKRFAASQMLPAVYDQTIFDVNANPPHHLPSPPRGEGEGEGAFLFRSTGQVMKFAGFMSVYLEGVDEEAARDEEENPSLPELSEGEGLKLHKLTPNQHFTQPPPRFSEASLVKELEEKGIGRPSTYASIMSTIQEKHYVKRQQKYFHPTQLGEIVNELLVQSFPEILDVKFTAQMEEELDDVEEGKRKWTEALNDFYGPFSKTLVSAEKKMKNLKAQVIPTDIVCEQCGKPMVVRWGRHGEFLACSGYPACRTTREFTREEGGRIEAKKEETSDEKCENCGAPMVVKRGRFGKFLACSRYPECKTTKAISTGVKCPECGGDVVSRRGRGGRSFYGCANYPKCKFVSWSKPVSEPCPTCGSPYLIEKYSKEGGVSIVCPAKGCGWKKN